MIFWWVFSISLSKTYVYVHMRTGCDVLITLLQGRGSTMIQGC
jgi:hypothetical protein